MKPFITLDEVVANAATIIPDGKQDPKLRNLMRQWTYLGERQLGFSGLHERVAENVPVSSLVISKPLDYAIGIDLALLDDEDNEYRWHYRNYSKRIHSNTILFSNSMIAMLNNNVPNEIGLSETPYTFILDSIGDKVTKVNIRYFSYPIDPSTNEMLIPEHHLMALMMFIYWMSRLRDQNATMQEKEIARANWLSSKLEAKSKNKVPSMLEGRDIARFYPSMINKVFHERY